MPSGMRGAACSPATANSVGRANVKQQLVPHAACQWHGAVTCTLPELSNGPRVPRDRMSLPHVGGAKVAQCQYVIGTLCSMGNCSVQHVVGQLEVSTLQVNSNQHEQKPHNGCGIVKSCPVTIWAPKIAGNICAPLCRLAANHAWHGKQRPEHAKRQLTAAVHYVMPVSGTTW